MNEATKRAWNNAVRTAEECIESIRVIIKGIEEDLDRGNAATAIMGYMKAVPELTRIGMNLERKRAEAWCEEAHQ